MHGLHNHRFLQILLKIKTKLKTIMQKFIIATIFCLIIFGVSLPKSQAQAIWDGTADITWYNTGETSFDISTAEQLAGVAQLVNNQGVTFNGVTLNLTAEIWLNGEQDSTNNWIPIGGSAIATGESATTGNAFEGHFNGNGYSIRNLYCDRSNYFHTGFFGAIKHPAVIDSLVFINPVLKSQGMMGTVVGFIKAGGDVYISNCMAINTRIHGTGGNNIGGIIGASYPNAEFLAGITYISNCGVTGYISGNYIGGIAGNGKKAYLSNTYFAGTLAPSSNNWGGLLGHCAAIDLNISNSYSNLPSPSPLTEGRDGTIVTDAYMLSPTFASDLGSAFIMDYGINNGYPILSYICTVTPAETEICLGESVTLTAQGYEFYSWSNGETTESITVSPTTTTTYTVTGTTTSGGNGTHTATVIVHPQATITASIIPGADGQTHGTVTPEVSTVSCGSSDLVTLTVNPDSNYHVCKVVVNGVEVYGDEFSEGETAITIDPNGTLADVKIFLSNTYNITTNLVFEDGTPINNSNLVQPYGTNGVYSVSPGDSVHYTFNETSRYQIVDVTIDGNVYGVIPSFDLVDIHESHTIIATYRDACGIAELPYNESFESTPTYSAPECYDIITNASITVNELSTHSGSKSVYSYLYLNYDYYLILPRIVDTLIYPISDLQVSFWAKSSSVSNTFTVGVISDPNDASTFSPIQTHTLLGSEFEQFTTYFNNFDLTGVYGNQIAIKINPGQNYTTCHIDDINVEITTTCSPVQNLELTSLYGSNITLTWDTNAVGGVSEYNITLYDVVNDYSVDYISYEPTITITGLSENTQYRAGVSVYCANGEYSDTAFVSFMTPCNSPVAITVDGGTSSTSNYLPTQSGYRYSYSQQIIPASKLGGNSQNFGGLALQYLDDVHSNRICDIYLAHVPSNIDLAFGWIIPDGTIEFTQVFSGSINFNNSGDDHWYKINFDTTFSYNGTDNLLVVFNDLTGSYISSRNFQCHEDSTTAYMACYSYRDGGSYSITSPGNSRTVLHKINNFQFLYCEDRDCISPNTLNVTDISSSSAEISWVTVGSETEWEVEYKSGNDTVWTSYGNVSNTPSVYLSPLSPETQYSVRVRAVCSITEFSNWSDEVDFVTPCTPITVTAENPWTEDFEGYTSSHSTAALSSCWATPETFPTDYIPSPFVYTGFAGSAHSGSNTLEMKGAPTMFALPEFANDLNTLSISFWANTTADDPVEAGTMLLGVISDINNPNSFVVVDTIPATAFNRIGTDAPHANYIGPFDFGSINPADGQRIAIRLQNLSSNSTSWNFDDFTVFLTPMCASPQKNSLTFADTTAYSVTVSWIDEDASHDSWSVYYKPSADSVWASDIAGPMPSHTLNNLTPETSYDVYVVSNCDVQDIVPDATFTKSFTTLISCPAPTDLTAISTTSDEATITWNGSADSYILEYEIGDSITGNSTIVTTTTNSITLSGLTSNSLYTIRVQGDCGNSGNLSSVVSTTFRTDCDVVTSFPYFESFENTLNCWDTEHLVGNADWYIESGMYLNTIPTPDSNHYAFARVANSGFVSQLISPTFDLSSIANPWIKFSHIQTEYFEDQDELHIYYKTSPTANPILLASYEENITYWKEDSLLLPNPTSEYQIIFEAHLYWGRGVGLDKITVYDGIAITEPTVATYNATDISQDAATLNGQITDLGNQTIISSGFEWKESSGSIYTSVESTGSTTLAYYLTGLAASTSYTYRAYVITANATTYGEEVTFVTLAEEAPTYTITASVSGPGTITPNGDVTVQEGEDITFSFAADEGAVIDRLLIDGVDTSIPADNSYTFTNVVANHTITVKFSEETGIEENCLDAAVALYPNPATSYIQIQMADNRFLGAEMQIFDAFGKLIATTTVEILSNRIDVSPLANGMYMVRINANEGTVVKRFVKR